MERETFTERAGVRDNGLSCDADTVPRGEMRWAYRRLTYFSPEERTFDRIRTREVSAASARWDYRLITVEGRDIDWLRYLGYGISLPPQRTQVPSGWYGTCSDSASPAPPVRKWVQTFSFVKYLQNYQRLTSIFDRTRFTSRYFMMENSFFFFFFL